MNVFFGNGGKQDDLMRVQVSSTSSSSNRTTAGSGTDTNLQTAYLIKAEIEDLIKNHRPKTEKEIKAEGDNKIRFWSMLFIFIVVAFLLVVITISSFKTGEQPAIVNGLMSLVTTLVGGIGGFIYGTKK
ncbi:hypothetical protein PNF55_000225 [Cronobacter sakazakii]|uniref:hypothetical protein n=1 Tax=Cronobacter sakazakii TaxID=28141 RepID=UPI001AEA7476|nr:hypothetical protein [Cronobacter sakazakii]EKK3986934.1 hypothetical protein [Cronobacter sakazakii]EKK4069831.1 hypothetical protein [Cronobacter sakazakii]ELY4106269.1 hypothetical protein [Cronobacter sakazakii]EMA4150760.1 hypothetical protein [Cronobacter sakazakii]